MEPTTYHGDSTRLAQDRLTRRTALLAAATGMGLAAAGAAGMTVRAAQDATPGGTPGAELAPTPQFLDVLGFDPSDPPNAALVVAAESDQADVIVVELTAPVYDPVAATLTYTAVVLEGYTELEATGTGFTVEPLAAGAIPATVGACSLFIDSLLRGCTPWDPRC